MFSSRFYFLQACYSWLLDSNLTPYLLVNLNISGVIFPIEYSDNNFIILNISRLAIRNFKLDKEKLTFDTCFHGKSYYVELPLNSIYSIYGHENNIGILFEKLKENFQIYFDDFNIQFGKVNFIKSFQFLGDFFEKNSDIFSKNSSTLSKKKPNLRIIK